MRKDSSGLVPQHMSKENTIEHHRAIHNTTNILQISPFECLRKQKL
uniref:Uncharacterized protein n=1 Tax=Siphoviridae sp. ctEJG5 TaxID=2827814 RepID=A0A8S5RXW1_9CAUD|nr:MAG TPA: hypothetical protein [Siphoviridae sp. ctEJG5]